MDDSELLRLAVRGLLAGAVSSELAAPLERIARVLEVAVERLDRHVATSRGPEPLPYQVVGEVRERVAEAFLEIGRATRLAADLARIAATTRPRAPERLDVNELVERALSLSRHRFAADAEVLLDLGTLPMVEVDAVRVVLALAQLLVIVAAASGAAATVVVHTAPTAHGVRVSVYHPGPPAPSSPFADLVRRDLETEGGTLTYTKDGMRSLAVVTLGSSK
jgi:C4-dicarboxylate-specific signal transduction histidine kinase